MSDAIIDQIRMHSQDRHCRSALTAQNLRSLTDDLKRHFQKNYPVMLDGALPRSDDHCNLLRQARESLTRGQNSLHLLPAAILRETLDAIPDFAERETSSSVKAGFTAVGSKTGRIWWDESVLDNLSDIVSRLDSPRAVLRFYDVTGIAPESDRWNEFFDIDVEIGARGKTVNFWSGDHAYIVDLGFVHADGRFLRLARTNLVHLPRDTNGSADTGAEARTLLKPRQKQTDPEVRPDESARMWATKRNDHEERDLDTELVVHMVYRSFLREGPRALKRAPRLFRRDPELLRKEYAQRRRVRERQVVVTQVKAVAPVVLAARIDTGISAASVRETYLDREAMLPAVVMSRRMAVPAAGDMNFSWYGSLLRASRRVAATGVLPNPGEMSVVRVETENEEPDELVASIPDGMKSDAPVSFMSNSVFEAAKNLRDSLSSMPGLDSLISEPEMSGMDTRELEETPVARRRIRERIEKSEEPVRLFGGAEAKRMAKAGVRFTRMSLTLEGRMRPGARLKVAGKLVHADADGRFRLECVLTGKRASIPMRAGASIGGEARSLINVEWEKRASREKKKIW